MLKNEAHTLTGIYQLLIIPVQQRDSWIHLANVELPNAELLNAELLNAELLNAELPNAELLNVESY
jgi:hypothetical protein